MDAVSHFQQLTCSYIPGYVRCVSCSFRPLLNHRSNLQGSHQKSWRCFWTLTSLYVFLLKLSVAMNQLEDTSSFFWDTSKLLNRVANLDDSENTQVWYTFHPCDFSPSPADSSAPATAASCAAVSPAFGALVLKRTVMFPLPYYHMAVCQNLVPLVNIKIAGKWMFIPLKMVLIGIDPYP